MGLLRRSKTTETPATAAIDAVEPTGKATGKGRPTPKRQRAAPPPPPPMSRKEAYARMRARSREERTEARAGMREGDDRYAMARDRGPVRRLVRDVVDARRNAGPYFFGTALIIVVVTSIPGLPPEIAFAVSYLWLVLIGVLIFDSFLLSRAIGRAINERFPDESESLRRHKFYGIMRAVTFRRLRNPKARVKIGHTIL